MLRMKILLPKPGQIEIYNETKIPLTVEFLEILETVKLKILGEKYFLSLNVLKGSNAKKLNQKIRSKDYIPNTLSFEYTKYSGEIILTPDVIKKEMANYKHTFNKHFLFLFIHSLLHLKKLKHGKKMEALEQKHLKRCGVV